MFNENDFQTGPVREREGSPERPSRTRNRWRIDLLSPVGATTEKGQELFFLTQTLVGTWEKDDTTEEWETVYVPRPPHFAPVQKVTLNYLDAEGSMRDAIRKDTR